MKNTDKIVLAYLLLSLFLCGCISILIGIFMKKIIDVNAFVLYEIIILNIFIILNAILYVKFAFIRKRENKDE